MKRFVFLITGFLLVNVSFSQLRTIPVLNFEQLEPYLYKNNDTIFIVNFWATWCTPCREELPALEMINEQYSKQKVKVLLVSLDFPNQIESQLIPYLTKNHIKNEVVLLHDPKQNEWINKVDLKWSGALPFTQIYSKRFRESYEKTFRYNELDSIIKLKLNYQ